MCAPYLRDARNQAPSPTAQGQRFAAAAAEHKKGGSAIEVTGGGKRRACFIVDEALLAQLHEDARRRNRSLNRWVVHVLALCSGPIADAQAEAELRQMRALAGTPEASNAARLAEGTALP